MKYLEVDRFGITVGDAIFAKFRINQLGDFVGEKIVQTVLLQRAGISDFDAIALVQVMADRLTPNELERWCSRCAFGTGQETTLRVSDHSVARYTDPSQQQKDFVDAMANLS